MPVKKQNLVGSSGMLIAFEKIITDLAKKVVIVHCPISEEDRQ